MQECPVATQSKKSPLQREEVREGGLNSPGDVIYSSYAMWATLTWQQDRSAQHRSQALGDVTSWQEVAGSSNHK